MRLHSQYIRRVVPARGFAGKEGWLVLILSGIHSPTRKAIFPDSDVEARLLSDFTFQVSVPQSAMYAEPLLKDIYDDPALQLYLAPNRHIVTATARSREAFEIQLTVHAGKIQKVLAHGSTGLKTQAYCSALWRILIRQSRKSTRCL